MLKKSVFHRKNRLLNVQIEFAKRKMSQIL